MEINRKNILKWIKDESNIEDIGILINTIKTRRLILGQELKSNLMIGQNVNVQTKSGIEKGIITKVMKTRCGVKFNSNGLNYAVPLSLIITI